MNIQDNKDEIEQDELKGLLVGGEDWYDEPDNVPDEEYTRPLDYSDQEQLDDGGLSLTG